MYQGGNPYSDEKKRGDLTTSGGRFTAAVDKNYEQYVMDTRSDPSSRLGRTEWYYATKGGQSVQPATKSTTTPTPTTTPTSTAPALAKEVSSIGGTGGSFQAWLADHPGGDVTLPDGTAGNVTGIVDTKSSKFGHAIAINVGGKSVLYNVERGYFLAVPKGSGRYLEPETMGLREYRTAAEAIAASA